MTQKTIKQFSPELRERAVRMVQDREREGGTRWESIGAIAAKFGCSRETLRRWIRQGERDAAERPSLTTTEERERIRALERENRELRQAHEILRKASAYFAQAELDCPLKRWLPLSTSTVGSMGSSRSAGCCERNRRAICARLPHRRITSTRRGAARARW